MTDIAVPVKLELRPRMNLAAERETLPLLRVQVTNKKRQPLSDTFSRIVSLVIRPDNHQLIYLEAVATSSSVAHAIMAAVSEGTDNVCATFGFYETKANGWAINLPSEMRVADCRVSLRGHSGLHHIALLSQDSDYIISDSPAQLWAKLRQRMGCPTKESWGEKILPQLLESSALLECESYGLPGNDGPRKDCPKCEGTGRVRDPAKCTCSTGHAPCGHCEDGEPCEACDGSGKERATAGMKVYVLDMDFEAVADRLVSEYVKQYGLEV